jgi:hypothetical protein
MRFSRRGGVELFDSDDFDSVEDCEQQAGRRRSLMSQHTAQVDTRASSSTSGGSGFYAWRGSAPSTPSAVQRAANQLTASSGGSGAAAPVAQLSRLVVLLASALAALVALLQ